MGQRVVSGAMELYASRSIPASREHVYGILEKLERHFELIGDRAERLSREGSGFRLRLRGPLGMRRTVRTSLTFHEPPELIVGRVEAGSQTRGSVRWTLQAGHPGTWVEIVARAESLGALDRMLLRLGGRRWLAQVLEAALAGLDAQTREVPSG